MKKWVVSKLDKQKASDLARESGLPPFISMLMNIRGINDIAAAASFLSDEPDIQDPFAMIDMDKAVERINSAIASFEKICVYGDYDADGVTSTTILYSYLDTLGADVMFYIPSRESEGYGLNIAAADKLNEYGVKLIITVDNGISAVKEIAYASTLGIDTVVTDHHTPPSVLPDAVAVVDPHREDCTSTFKNLAGVGVAFKLIMALEGEDGDFYGLLDNYADLVAIGTIGDIVSLTGENRSFVKYGLRAIANAERTSIISMLEEAGLDSEKIKATDLAYSVVPRINALGRLDTCDRIVNFLLSEDKDETDELAQMLGENNKKRHTIEVDILTQACDYIENSPQVKHEPVIVVSGENWHGGVIGIVAARIKEMYGKPAIVISYSGEDAKGSGRSIEGFSICDALFSCADVLTAYGGHPLAAGLSMKTADIDEFRKRINEYALQKELAVPKINIDCKLKPAALQLDMAYQLAVLEPYGAGNPSPLFGLFDMKITGITPVGGNKHLRLKLEKDGTAITAMYFSCCIEDFSYSINDIVDAAVMIGINNYNSQDNLSVIVKELRFASADTEQMFRDVQLFDSFILGKDISSDQAKYLYPDRNNFADVYRCIRSSKSNIFYLDTMCHTFNNSINCGKLLVILKAMEQLGLINIQQKGQKYTIDMNEVQVKVSLDTAPAVIRLNEILREG